MQYSFPLFQSPIDLAHTYWTKLIQPNSVAIDATCGNGKDTAFLAGLPTTKIYAIDIQAEALQKAKAYFDLHLTSSQKEKIRLIQGCHSHFPTEIEDVHLIVYNLGYLPGGDKSVTTLTDKTLQSIQHGMTLLVPGGVISITCYPGHAEGKKEEQKILEMVSDLSAGQWSCCQHAWHNRKASPSLLIIQRAL